MAWHRLPLCMSDCFLRKHDISVRFFYTEHIYQPRYTRPVPSQSFSLCPIPHLWSLGLSTVTMIPSDHPLAPGAYTARAEPYFALMSIPAKILATNARKKMRRSFQPFQRSNRCLSIMRLSHTAVAMAVGISGPTCPGRLRLV